MECGRLQAFRTFLRYFLLLANKNAILCDEKNKIANLMQQKSR